MNTNWKSPNAIVGSGAVARGDNYYQRNDVVEEIWNKLKNDSVLLVAPRRVGKTSVMQYMVQNPIENHRLIFQDVEGISSADDFFKRIYSLLFNCLSTNKKLQTKFRKITNSKTVKSIAVNRIEFENTPPDYLNATNNLLAEINKIQELENIVLLLDELPIALSNINENSNKDAISVLSNLRYWRQQPEMNKKVKFVFAGSIGIHYVVGKIKERSADLDELVKIDFKPLSDHEAHKYIDWATKGATVTYDTELKKHFLSKIQYFVPYFINLLLDEVNKQAKKINNPKITTQNIDVAFDNIIKTNDYLKDWKKRLRNYMSEDFNFVNEILTHTAHNGQITLHEIYDKTVKYGKTADFMDFINDLEKDGYITEVENKYCFVSPFLSALWKNYNA